MKSFLNMVAMKGANVRGSWQAQSTGRVLRKSAATATKPAALIELAFQFDCCGIQIAPMQIHSEISALLEFLKTRRPERVLEIGTASGGTFFLLTRVASEAACQIFWREVKQSRRAREFVESWEQGGYGIGCAKKTLRFARVPSGERLRFPPLPVWRARTGPSG